MVGAPVETFSNNIFRKLYNFFPYVKRNYHGNDSMGQGCNPNLRKDEHHTGLQNAAAGHVLEGVKAVSSPD